MLYYALPMPLAIGVVSNLNCRSTGKYRGTGLQKGREKDNLGPRSLALWNNVLWF